WQRLQELSERDDDEWRDDDRRQVVRNLHVADVQKFETDADDEQPADRAHLAELKLVEEPAEQRRAEGEPALVHEDQRDGQQDAPTQGRGKGDRGEPVEDALDRKQRRISGQAVADRPKESEWSDAEDDRRGHE